MVVISQSETSLNIAVRWNQLTSKKLIVSVAINYELPTGATRPDNVRRNFGVECGEELEFLCPTEYQAKG